MIYRQNANHRHNYYTTKKNFNVKPLFPISKIPSRQLEKTNTLRISPLNGVSVSPFSKLSKLHLNNSLK